MRKLIKRALAMQFAAMCETVPLKDISIKDFIEFAGISKQTFYNHFKDKFDLMNYVFEIAAQSIICDMSPSIQGMRYGASKMAHVCLNNRKFYTQVANYETQNSFAKYFTQSVEAVYRQKLIEIQYMKPTDVQKSQVVHNFCVGICTFYVDWIRNGMKESPHYVAETIIASMPSDIKHAFESVI